MEWSEFHTEIFRRNEIVQTHHHIALNIRPTAPEDQISGAGRWTIYQDEWVTIDAPDGVVIERSHSIWSDGFATAAAAQNSLPSIRLAH